MPPIKTVTPASEWKKTTELVDLPSGKVAELKRPSALSMVLRDGNIPDALGQMVTETLASGQATGWKPTAADLPLIAELVDTLCRAAFVNPKISDTPDYEKGEIALEDVMEGDKFFIFRWAMNGGGQFEAASRFPAQPGSNLSSSQDGRGLRKTPKRHR